MTTLDYEIIFEKVIQLMLAEAVKNNTPERKKINVLEKLEELFKYDENYFIYRNIFSVIIDLIVSLDKGKIKIYGKKCFKKCF